MDLSKIEIDILNLRTEGYVLSYDEIESDITEICYNYKDNTNKYIILSSTLYNKMLQNNNNKVYFKSDQNGHNKIVDIIFKCYKCNGGNILSNDFLFNYDKDHRKNKELIRFLNNKEWYYSH